MKGPPPPASDEKPALLAHLLLNQTLPLLIFPSQSSIFCPLHPSSPYTSLIETIIIHSIHIQASSLPNSQHSHLPTCSRTRCHLPASWRARLLPLATLPWSPASSTSSPPQMFLARRTLRKSAKALEPTSQAPSSHPAAPVTRRTACTLCSAAPRPRSSMQPRLSRPRHPSTRLISSLPALSCPRPSPPRPLPQRPSPLRLSSLRRSLPR